jgi:glucose/arabinose dehydrogenase
MGDAVRMRNLTNLTAASFAALFTYADGQIRITVPVAKLADLPGGLIDHHWTNELGGQPRRIDAIRRGWLQQHHRERHGSGERPRRDLGGSSILGPLAYLRGGLRNPDGLAI